jgi:hypothetical protein
MSEINTGGPAFPGVRWVQQGDKVNPEGMTLRDYFAAKAMQAMLTLEQLQMRLGRDINMEQIAGASYEWADAMLKARGEK